MADHDEPKDADKTPVTIVTGFLGAQPCLGPHRRAPHGLSQRA